jgi:hypothetical protein
MFQEMTSFNTIGSKMLKLVWISVKATEQDANQCYSSRMVLSMEEFEVGAGLRQKRLQIVAIDKMYKKSEISMILCHQHLHIIQTLWGNIRFMNQHHTVGGNHGIMLEQEEELSAITTRSDTSLPERVVILPIMNARSRLIL